MYKKLCEKVFIDDSFSFELYFKNRIKSNVYYDFETTFDEEHVL